MRKIVIILLVLVSSPLITLAAYTPKQQAWIGLLNDTTTVTITTLDAWTDVDGLSDIGFGIDPGFVACNSKGLSVPVQDVYEISVFANFTKAAGANNVEFDFAITADSVPFPYFTKNVVTSAGQFLSSSATVKVPLSPGVCYGVAVRNTTNTDNIVFFNYTFNITRIR